MVVTPTLAVLLTLLFDASSVYAATTPTLRRRSLVDNVNVRHPSTHSVRSIGSRELEVQAYHPKTTYKTWKQKHQKRTFSEIDSRNLKGSSMGWIESELDIPRGALTWIAGVDGDVAQYAYVKQSHNGIPFSNAVASVVFKDGHPIAFSSSITKPSHIANSEPTVTKEDAILIAEDAAEARLRSNGNPYDDTNDAEGRVDVELEYFITGEDNRAVLTWEVQVYNPVTSLWMEVNVDAHDGTIVAISDFISDATYSGIPADEVDITSGLKLIRDPEDLAASPIGWHDDGVRKYQTTTGNNVKAFRNSKPNNVTQANFGMNDQLIFNFTFTRNAEPSERQNPDLATTNAFAMMNTIHDITYRYGFTEKTFNFQANNLGKGGKGGDPVLLNVHELSDSNNANFGTGPDGQPGECNMFFFTLTKPHRDTALANDVIIHEMMHGVTNRMTGGGTAKCLQTAESRGLGEGWGDALANWMQQKSSTVTDFAIGVHVANKPQGIRVSPYSTRRSANNLTYSRLTKFDKFHEFGTVWATMLHDVYAALVAEKGFAADAKTNPDGEEGNVVFMHLMLDALLAQPCNPTFVQARDAWATADEARYGGAHTCIILKAFAARGLGAGAKSGVYEDDFTLDEECDV